MPATNNNTSPPPPPPPEEEEEEDLQTLQTQLATLTLKIANLKSTSSPPPTPPPPPPPPRPPRHNQNHGYLATSRIPRSLTDSFTFTTTQAFHLHLLLCDSALPLGSFAFSSGLESYFAHHLTSSSSPCSTTTSTTPTTTTTTREKLTRFLTLSLTSLSTTTLPFLISTFESPTNAIHLDDEYDASQVCSVAKRASVSQGRAVLGVWEKSFAVVAAGVVAVDIAAYRASMRRGGGGGGGGGGGAEEGVASGHFPIAYALLCRAFDLPLSTSAYLFLHSHMKSILSAAVRLGIIGPYVAQNILASVEMQDLIRDALEKGGRVERGRVGQTVPMLEIYGGRHEVLYSRVFNS